MNADRVPHETDRTRAGRSARVQPPWPYGQDVLVFSLGSQNTSRCVHESYQSPLRWPVVDKRPLLEAIEPGGGDCGSRGCEEGHRKVSESRQHRRCHYLRRALTEDFENERLTFQLKRCCLTSVGPLNKHSTWPLANPMRANRWVQDDQRSARAMFHSKRCRSTIAIQGKSRLPTFATPKQSARGRTPSDPSTEAPRLAKRELQ